MVSAVVAQHGQLGLGHRLKARVAAEEVVEEEEDVVPQVVEEEERVAGVVVEAAAAAATARTKKESIIHAVNHNRDKIANSKQTPISFGI